MITFSAISAEPSPVPGRGTASGRPRRLPSACMAASLMMRTGLPNAAAKSKPTQPGPRLPGSERGPKSPTGPGNRSRSLRIPSPWPARRPSSTIRCGVIVRPVGPGEVRFDRSRGSSPSSRRCRRRGWTSVSGWDDIWALSSVRRTRSYCFPPAARRRRPAPGPAGSGRRTRAAGSFHAERTTGRASPRGVAAAAASTTVSAASSASVGSPAPRGTARGAPPA